MMQAKIIIEIESDCEEINEYGDPIYIKRLPIKLSKEQQIRFRRNFSKDNALGFVEAIREFLGFYVDDVNVKAIESFFLEASPERLQILKAGAKK